MTVVEFVTQPCRVCNQRSKVLVDPDSLAEWRRGQYVQIAFPDMTPEQRELLVSGTHASCWRDLFGDDE